MTSHKATYLPFKDYELPNIDILTLIYESPESWSKESTILHAEAALPSNCLTKAQSRAYTMRLAHILRHQFGVGASGPGREVVVCISSGQILLSNLFYAVIAAGGVFSAASSSFTSLELARQVKHGKSNLIICSSDCADVATNAAKQSNVPLERILVLESMGGKRLLQDVERKGRNLIQDDWKKEEVLGWEKVTDRKVLEERVICLMYSSGTTGTPKGVNISHANLVSEGLIPQYMLREFLARERRLNTAFNFEYRTLAHLPAAHIAGIQGYHVNPSIAGGTVYWMPKFDFPKFLEYNKKLRITHFFTVPPIYLLIAKSPLVEGHFETLVHAIAGAAPMGPELQAMAEKKLGCRISQTWGLSETTGSVTGMPWDQDDKTGSVSPLLPNIRMRIVDDEENDVEEGLEGELIVQGPMVTKGYWDNDTATRDSFTRDALWFKTGDIGVCRNNMFYIVDRKKELIKYKGLQIAPAELEAFLLAHPLIQDVAVIGIPDSSEHGNELPRAYVVADKSRISKQEIKEVVKRNLAPHKQLRGGVVYLDTIPKSPSGKILRKELRESAKRATLGEQAKL